MISSDNFGARLTQILDHFGLSASAFADLIQVQRSSISHILSGRNKPSLDFIIKLNTTCPDINLYWFLNGKGNINTKHSPTIVETNKKNDIGFVSKNTSADSKSTIEPKKVERIVMFYTDGTFESYSEHKINER